MTLIELMVALAVLAILATLAAPSFADAIDRARVKSAAEEVVSLIATARGEAVKTGRDVSVSIGGTTSVWCVGANQAAIPAAGSQHTAQSSCTCTNASQCFVDGVRRVASASNYGGVTISAVGGAFVFDGKLGNVANLASPAAVTFTSPRGLYDLRLQVSPIGQTNVCVPSGKTAVSGYKSC